MKMAIYYLTCADDWEADKIAKSLLTKKLIVCAKQMPVSSTFRWKGKIAQDKEIVLTMESLQENFARIEREVRKLHSDETFVLYSISAKTTKGVEKWIEEELG
jgi:periplasmic divalent cation tolerance protein